MFEGLFCFFKFDLKVDTDGERRHSSGKALLLYYFITALRKKHMGFDS